MHVLLCIWTNNGLFTYLFIKKLKNLIKDYLAQLKLKNVQKSKQLLNLVKIMKKMTILSVITMTTTVIAVIQAIFFDLGWKN